MERSPRISIVTPSFNQGKYIAETIESVLAQDYPDVEHVVMDGGSTDSTLDILARYPHLKLVSEPDRGQAHAINKGFSMATGDIWGYLCSDDTLLPGALRRVAVEIDPERGRHVVMGRCLFVDHNGRYLGFEHPSHFQNHCRVLAIWKGYTIPQPAVFWTPEVWERCGPMDESAYYHMDYDLFCRFSRHYKLHFVDQPLATYRLQAESKTQRLTEAERLEDCIRLSQRYWGSPLKLTYWQLAASLAWYRFDRFGRARGLLDASREARRQGQVVRGTLYGMAAATLAPELAFYTVIYPPLKEHAQGILLRILERLVGMGRLDPQTALYFDHTDMWSDKWAGPRLVTTRRARRGARAVLVRGWVDLRLMRKPFVLTVLMDGVRVGQQRLEQSGDFEFVVALPERAQPGPHQMEVQANSWFVPHRYWRNNDFRPLSWRVQEVLITRG